MSVSLPVPWSISVSFRQQRVGGHTSYLIPVIFTNSWSCSMTNTHTHTHTKMLDMLDNQNNKTQDVSWVNRKKKMKW